MAFDSGLPTNTGTKKSAIILERPAATRAFLSLVKVGPDYTNEPQITQEEDDEYSLLTQLSVQRGLVVE